MTSATKKILQNQLRPLFVVSDARYIGHRNLNERLLFKADYYRGIIRIVPSMNMPSSELAATRSSSPQAMHIAVMEL